MGIQKTTSQLSLTALHAPAESAGAQPTPPPVERDLVESVPSRPQSAAPKAAPPPAQTGRSDMATKMQEARALAASIADVVAHTTALSLEKMSGLMGGGFRCPEEDVKRIVLDTFTQAGLIERMAEVRAKKISLRTLRARNAFTASTLGAVEKRYAWTMIEEAFKCAGPQGIVAPNAPKDKTAMVRELMMLMRSDATLTDEKTMQAMAAATAAKIATDDLQALLAYYRSEDGNHIMQAMARVQADDKVITDSPTFKQAAEDMTKQIMDKYGDKMFGDGDDSGESDSDTD